MDKWTEKAREALEEAPVGAMSFSRLIQALRVTGVSVEGREDWILERMREQPDSFTVIPDRLGPWVRCQGKQGSETHARSPVGGRADPWILTRARAAPGYGTHERAIGRLQESIQSWGRDLDRESQVAVARWIRATREAEKALSGLFRTGTEWAGTPRSTTRPPGRPPARKGRRGRQQEGSSPAPP